MAYSIGPVLYPRLCGLYMFIYEVLNMTSPLLTNQIANLTPAQHAIRVNNITHLRLNHCSVFWCKGFATTFHSYNKSHKDLTKRLIKTFVNSLLYIPHLV